MKKKNKINLVILCILLFLPFMQVYKYGGTKTFTSLTYKVIVWHALGPVDNPIKTGVEIHLFPFHFSSLSYFE